MDELIEHEAGGIPRRAIFRGLGLGIGLIGLGGASTLLSGCSGEGGDDDNNGDLTRVEEDILTFALNLEYLEAEIYVHATSGRGISDPASQIPVNEVGETGGTLGPTTVNLPTGFSPDTFLTNTLEEVVNELANDEGRHVIFLRNFLTQRTGRVIPKPAINLTPTSGVSEIVPSGNMFNSERDFLIAIRAIEDIGVTAYTQAIAELRSSSELIAVAAQILAAEAMHSGNIRLAAAQGRISTPTLPGGKDTKVFESAGNGRFFNTGANSLGFSRTAAEVLTLLGPFFPNGVNTIRG